MHSVPNDETMTVKLPEQANKKGELSDPQKYGTTYVAVNMFSVLSECLIKSLINPRNVAKMETTFGAWMKDTAELDDERIWVAEHFSGQSFYLKQLVKFGQQEV